MQIHSLILEIRRLIDRFCTLSVLQQVTSEKVKQEESPHVPSTCIAASGSPSGPSKQGLQLPSQEAETVGPALPRFTAIESQGRNMLWEMTKRPHDMEVVFKFVVKGPYEQSCSLTGLEITAERSSSSSSKSFIPLTYSDKGALYVSEWQRLECLKWSRTKQFSYKYVLRKVGSVAGFVMVEDQDRILSLQPGVALRIFDFTESGLWRCIPCGVVGKVKAMSSLVSVKGPDALCQMKSYLIAVACAPEEGFWVAAAKGFHWSMICGARDFRTVQEEIGAVVCSFLDSDLMDSRFWIPTLLLFLGVISVKADLDANLYQAMPSTLLLQALSLDDLQKIKDHELRAPIREGVKTLAIINATWTEDFAWIPLLNWDKYLKLQDSKALQRAVYNRGRSKRYCDLYVESCRPLIEKSTDDKQWRVLEFLGRHAPSMTAKKQLVAAVYDTSGSNFNRSTFFKTLEASELLDLIDQETSSLMCTDIKAAFLECVKKGRMKNLGDFRRALICLDFEGRDIEAITEVLFDRKWAGVIDLLDLMLSEKCLSTFGDASYILRKCSTWMGSLKSPQKDIVTIFGILCQGLKILHDARSRLQENEVMKLEDVLFKSGLDHMYASATGLEVLKSIPKFGVVASCLKSDPQVLTRIEAFILRQMERVLRENADRENFFPDALEMLAMPLTCLDCSTSRSIASSMVCNLFKMFEMRVISSKSEETYLATLISHANFGCKILGLTKQEEIEKTIDHPLVHMFRLEAISLLTSVSDGNITVRNIGKILSIEG